MCLHGGWGDPLWRGFVRGLCMGVAGGGLMLLAGWAAILSDYGLINRKVFLYIVVLFCLAFICLLGIYLVNQPRFLVPPHLRRQPGAFEEWAGELASRLPSRRAK